MRNISLKFGGKSLREFSSVWQFLAYGADVVIRVALLSLFTTIGIVHFFIPTSSYELNRFIAIYVVAIIAWGFLLLKYVYVGKEAFGKTKFDVFFMGLLVAFLISVLFGQNKNVGIFGAFNTWSYSVSTLLCVSIIYYVMVVVFKYLRGVKWIGLGILLSIFVSGTFYLLNFNSGRDLNDIFTILIYTLFLIPIAGAVFSTEYKLWIKVAVVSVIALLVYLSRNFFSGDPALSLDFLRYVVFTIPVCIALIFIFRKLYLKILTAGALIINLFFISDYSQFISSSMFILSVGVLVLFILFYFSYWIKNVSVIINFFRGMVGKIRNLSGFKKYIKANKKEGVITLLVFFIALWIIGFGAVSWNYWDKNIGVYIGGWYEADLSKMQGVKMWLIGQNNLSSEFSAFEVLNILGNYGLFSTLLFLGFFAATLYHSARIVLKFLYSGLFKNVVLTGSIFIGEIMLLVTFFIMRFSAFSYFVFIIYTALLAVISDLIDQKDVYKIKTVEQKVTTKVKGFKVVLSFALIALIILGIIGLLSGIDREIYWGRI